VKILTPLLVLALLLFSLPAAAADACPVPPITLSAGVQLSILDTTRGTADNFTSFCDASGGAPDVVYAFTLPAAGTLKIRVDAINVADDAAGLFNPAVYVRTDCATDFVCFDSPGASETVAGDFAAGTYHVIVDGSGGSSGRFKLSALFNEPVCGDAVLNVGEACDPGPGQPGDGCGDPGAANECELEAAGSDDTCPGTAVTIGAGTSIIHGSSIGYTDDYLSPHAAVAGGPDRVYQLTPLFTGTMTVTIGLGADGSTDVCDADPTSGACWDRALYARSTCLDETFAAELGFSDQGAYDVEEISFAVTAGEPVFVVVDGYDDQFYSSGVFDLKVDLGP
jgi:hypothetical protein